MAIYGVERVYFKKFKFVVEILGVKYAGFKSCSEIAFEVAKIEQWEGGSLIPNKSPGRVTIPDVTLERGATADIELYTWMQQVVAMDAILLEPQHKRTIDVVQQDRKGNPVRRWTLVGAWPTKFVGGAWDNGSDENTMESVTLAYDYPIIKQ